MSYNNVIPWVYSLNSFRNIFELRDGATQEFKLTSQGQWNEITKRIKGKNPNWLEQTVVGYLQVQPISYPVVRVAGLEPRISGSQGKRPTAS